MSVCEFCVEGKMTKRPFFSKGNRANDLLELVYTDTYGPINLKREKDTSILSLSQMIAQNINTYTYAPQVRDFWKVQRVSSGNEKAIR